MTCSQLLSLGAGALPLALVLFQGTPAEKPKVEVYAGKVVPLADALKRHGIDLDPDAKQHWLALQADDGKLYPLVKDEGARMFFRDPTLLNRPMSLRGRLVANTGLLQVLQVQSIKDGKLHDVYYWCEVCTIKRFSLEKSGICECCGGPMERREVPAQK